MNGQQPLGAQHGFFHGCNGKRSLQQKLPSTQSRRKLAERQVFLSVQSLQCRHELESREQPDGHRRIRTAQRSAGFASWFFDQQRNKRRRVPKLHRLLCRRSSINPLMASLTRGPACSSSAGHPFPLPRRSTPRRIKSSTSASVQPSPGSAALPSMGTQVSRRRTSHENTNRLAAPRLFDVSRKLGFHLG